MFSVTVSVSTSMKCWCTMPMPRSIAWRGPLISTTLAVNENLPPSASSSPYATFMSVDFPAPFSPRSATTSPTLTSSETSSSARTPGNRLVMWSSRRTGVLPAVELGLATHRHSAVVSHRRSLACQGRPARPTAPAGLTLLTRYRTSLQSGHRDRTGLDVGSGLVDRGLDVCGSLASQSWYGARPTPSSAIPNSLFSPPLSVPSTASLTVSNTALSTRLTADVTIVSPMPGIVSYWSASTPMKSALPSCAAFAAAEAGLAGGGEDDVSTLAHERLGGLVALLLHR